MTYQEMLEKLTIGRRARRECWEEELFMTRASEGLMFHYPEEVVPFELDEGFGADPSDEDATDWVLLEEAS